MPNGKEIAILHKILSQITRIEVIDDKGRAYTKWDCVVTPDIQDDGRTLKLFIGDKQS